MYFSSSQSNNPYTKNTQTNTARQYASLGKNFGYNQYLDELGTKLNSDHSFLKGLGDYSAQLEKHYKLDRVIVPPSRGRNELDPEKTQKALVQYNQLTFGEKEALLAKLVQKIIGEANGVAAAAAGANDDNKKPMQNLMFDLLFLQQTPQFVSPRYIATPTKSLVRLADKINTLANDPAVLEALKLSSAHKLEHPLSLKNCTIFLLSATTGILVGYVLMHGMVGPMTFFPNLHKDALIIGFKVYTIIKSADQGRTLKESLEIMARTGARELLQYSSASMIMGLTSNLTSKLISGGAEGFVEKHLGYMACRMVTFITNSGVQVMMQNITYIQPTTHQQALTKEYVVQKKRQQEQQDFIDLCNEIQRGYRTPLRILKNSFHTFKLVLDAKTKRHPYVASMLIVLAASVMSNTILDMAIGEADTTLALQLPFGLHEHISTFLDTTLIKETVKRTYLFPFVFRTINELVPLKKQVMAQMTALLKMTPDEFITMEKIVERKLTLTMLFKNIVRFLTNAAVTITQEDFIRGGVSYDFVNKADTLYNNLDSSLRESINKILSLPQEHMHHLFQEATRVFNGAAEGIEGLFQGVRGVAEGVAGGIESIMGAAEQMREWFKNALETLFSAISTTLASSKTDTQVSQKESLMAQIATHMTALQTTRGDNTKDMEAVVVSMNKLEEALAANRDILFPDQIDQITGDLAQLRATIDDLQGENKAIDALTSAYQNDIKLRADSTTFQPDGGGPELLDALGQFAQQAQDLLGGMAKNINAALDTARMAQNQITDNRAQYEAYTEMSRLYSELKTQLPDLISPSLRDKHMSLYDIEKHTKGLKEASQQIQALQENMKRHADDVVKLTKISEKTKDTDLICQQGFLYWNNKTCKELAVEDLKTLTQYTETEKTFKEQMTAALNAHTTAFKTIVAAKKTLVEAETPLPPQLEDAATGTTLPVVPPYPFKINPSLKKFVVAWEQMEKLQKLEGFKVFEDILKANDLSLSKTVFKELINDETRTTKKHVFEKFNSAIKIAHKDSLIDKTLVKSVSAQANIQHVSMSQTHNLYVKNDPLASSHSKERIRNNFLQTINNVQTMMTADRTLESLHEKTVKCILDLARGSKDPIIIPTSEEIDEAVAQTTKAANEVAATQDNLNKAILLDYTNHVFKTNVVTNVANGENPDVSDFSQVKITLSDIRAFNERNTMAMFDGLLSNNPLFKSKYEARLATGPILDTEMAMMIEEEFHTILDKYLLPPTHPNYDARSNQIIISTLLEDPANMEFESLVKMQNGLDNFVRQQAVTVGLGLAKMAGFTTPIAAVGAAATSGIYTTVKMVTGLESSIDKTMKFFDYFARFAKTDNHAVLNQARNFILDIQKSRLNFEGSIDSVVQSSIGKFVQAKLNGENTTPMTVNTVNLNNFIATMALHGETSETFQNVFLEPIFKDRTGFWFGNMGNYVLENTPYFSYFSPVKKGSDIFSDMTNAMGKDVLTGDKHMNYLVFGHGYDFEKVSAQWSTARPQAWLSWAASSTSLGDDIVKYFTPLETEQYNQMDRFYTANKALIFDMCRTGDISTQYNFLCKL